MSIVSSSVTTEGTTAPLHAPALQPAQRGEASTRGQAQSSLMAQSEPSPCLHSPRVGLACHIQNELILSQKKTSERSFNHSACF